MAVERSPCKSKLINIPTASRINIPTGLGKTAALSLQWGRAFLSAEICLSRESLPLQL